MKKSGIFFLLTLLLLSCRDKAEKADAYGNFEADERIVSAEASGPILMLTATEGEKLQEGQLVGAIDSLPLTLRREQLRASIQALAAKSPAIAAQLAVYEKQLAANSQQRATLEREKQRIEGLLKSDAATPKQLDDINAQLEQTERQAAVVSEQRNATNASLNVQQRGLLAEALPIQKQIAQLNDQIARCRIRNPIAGTVLVRYAEPGEVTAFGRPLYKIADLDHLSLRAYVAGDQLGLIKTGQNVQVFIDAPGGSQKAYTGIIRWIASEAEFTPKIIQTKDERVNLVYAVKIEVPNEDGSLKIGMPAEVKF